MSALTARLIILGFSLLTTAFGLAIVVLPLRKLYKAKKTYDLVSATCIRVEAQSVRTEEGSSSICYRPIWEYTYAGTLWTSHTNSSASYLNIPVGTVKDIYVCPDEPEKIVVPFTRDTLSLALFGSVWLIAGVAGCIYALLVDL